MKILLHMCCANCAIYPLRILRDTGQTVTGYFYNPNIHPYLEYRRRLETVRDYAAQSALPMLWQDDYALEEFLSHVAANPGIRCNYCYRSRLEATARTASTQGFDGFTTSLLYSRYQQHDTIRICGEEMAHRYGVTFLYADYRSGWNEGIRESKALGLYRQQYCGCIYSEKERYRSMPSAQATPGYV